jgi:hypothetical protein
LQVRVLPGAPFLVDQSPFPCDSFGMSKEAKLFATMFGIWIAGVAVGAAFF